MTALSWLIVISALCCQGISASWLTFAKRDQGHGILDTIWKHVTSLITWFDSGGYDLFGVCPEGDEPDWDLFEPEGKRCRKLSELLYSDNYYFQTLLSGVQTYMPDLSSLGSALKYVRGLRIWQTLYSILTVIATALQPYLYLLENAWRNVLLYASSLEIYKRIPVLFPSDYIRTCFYLYLSNCVLYNNTSLSLIVTAACLTCIYVGCKLFAEDDNTSCTFKRVTFSDNDSQTENGSRRPQRLARIRPSKKDRQRKKKRQRQRASSPDSSTDPDTCRHNLISGPQDHSAICCLLTSRTGNNLPDSSHIDDEALSYIVGGATDSAPDEIKERIRKALQMIVSHEEEECCRPSPGSERSRKQGSSDDPGTVSYDIRYKDKLPPDVMDVLFCIDPHCKHDHSRYEMRGCQILVKPEDYREKSGKPSPESKTRPKKIRSEPPNRSKGIAKEQTGNAKANANNSDANAYSTIEVSPTEVHVWGQDKNFVDKYHETLTGKDMLHGAVTGSKAGKDRREKEDTDNSLSKQIRGQDALEEVPRVDSFPDWRAPGFDQDCPYCKVSMESAKVSRKGTNGDSDGSSSDLSPYSSGEQDSPDKIKSSSASDSRDSSPGEGGSGVSGPNPERTEKEIMELLGEAALEEAIGPPQANSSFQKDENQWTSEMPKKSQGNERDMEYSSQKILRRRANKNRVHPTKTNGDVTTSDRGPEAGSSGLGGVMYESLRIIQPPTRDPTRNGDAFQRNSCSVQIDIARRPRPVFVRTVEPLNAPIRRVRVRGDGESRGADELNDQSVDNDSVPAFDEDEFSLSRELQNTFLNDSQVAVDLSELNRSLSFFGDVSMVELAASWVVKNVVERATKYMLALYGPRLQESILNISNGIIDVMDLVE